MPPRVIKTTSPVITSEDTSVKQVPATFKLVVWEKGTTNFDMGCGKWPALFTEALARMKVTNIPYDPYHVRENEDHHKAMEHLGKKLLDTVTCNNVLNVLNEERMIANVIKHCAGVVRKGGIAYFLIYEGDGSGVAGPTSKGWQNNRKAETYVEEIQKVFPYTRRRGNLIAASDTDQTMYII